MCLGMPTIVIKITAIMHVHTTEYTGLILSIFLTDLEHVFAQLKRLSNLKREMIHRHNRINFTCER